MSYNDHKSEALEPLTASRTSDTLYDQDHDEYDYATAYSKGSFTTLQWTKSYLQSWRAPRPARYHRLTPSSYNRAGTTWTRLLFLVTAGAPTVLLLVLLCTAIFFPSYTNPPTRYQILHERARQSHSPGRANINNEKVFIATSIYDQDGSLVSGAWGQAVLELVDILGPNNVFLSLYENDVDSIAKEKLDLFSERLTCNSSIVAEHLDTSNLTHVHLPSGERVLKRISFLAQVRNRALAPLDDPTSAAHYTRFDKLLFVNDVVFNPVDAANLLFSTNANEDGKTQYRAACATDFINPWKFYDQFATRDLEGNSMGVPIYPWFTNAGLADSRHDVLGQSDAVRVRSCWGGMVAFDATLFQGNVSDPSPAPARLAANTSLDASKRPFRFRANDDIFWDASECCLINADIQVPRGNNVSAPSGVYLNPYVRVAYTAETLRWLHFTRRFERLYSPIQRLLCTAVGMPKPNPRRLEEPGQQVTDSVWAYDDGQATADGELTGDWKEVKRIAPPGAFCGGKKLLVLEEGEHKGHWYSYKGFPLTIGPVDT